MTLPSKQFGRRWRLRLATLLAAPLAACDGDPAAPGPDGVLAISRDSVEIRIGDTLQLTATVQAGTRIQTATGLRWVSRDPSRVGVSDGLVRGLAAGRSWVVATSGSMVDSALVTVRDPTTPMVEGRALWVNRFEYDSPAKIATILDKARGARFNVVYFQVRGQGDAYYRSTLEPCAIALCGRLGNGQPSWDPLEVAIREAHSRGIQLHAWINAFSAFSAPQGNPAFCSNLVDSAPGSPQHMLRAHPDWAVVNRSGARETCESSGAQGLEYLYVSPGIPAVRTHLARVAADIARRYPQVDGIHLDRVRYPGSSWSHDPTSLRLFGGDPAADPQGWAGFRRERVNLAVKEVYDSLRAANPRVALSAAVWGIHEDRWGWGSSRGYGQYFQDPRAWAAGGYLDVAVPMTYFRINAQSCGFADWACLLDDHLQGIQQATGRHLYIGIAANLGAAEVERQIRLGRERGVRGFSLYSYNAVESANLWAALASGVFSAPAAVPGMGWK